eukprot:c15759_g1_i1 orf=103-1287(-)
MKGGLLRTVLVLFLLALALQPLSRLLTSTRSQANNSSPPRKLPLAVPSSSPSSCNLFEGEWIAGDDEGYPLYKPGSCPFVEDSFSCFANGRPDSGFSHWRWLPDSCPIPRFSGRNLLERLRGKRLVFVGDSLSRNQWESMLCLLTQALPNKSRVVEVNGQQITKDRGAFHFQFQDYDCHVEYYSSHFLVEEEYNMSTSRLIELRLDRLHPSHSQWANADVLVFTTGHWWTHGKTARGKNIYREENTVYPKLNLMVAFTKALRTWATWVDRNVNREKTTVFLVGYSPGHFRGGKWNSGGECQNATWPIRNVSQIPKYPEKMLVIERIIHDMKFPVKLLDITRLSSYRSDGHPSIYGIRNVQGYQDCSHWCLPGVPDVWNVLLYASLIMDEKAVHR